MTDPRASLAWDELNAVYETFKIDDSSITYDATKNGGSDQVGLAVRLSAGETIALTQAGSAVIGKLKKVESDNFALVQVGGCMTLPAGTGNASNNVLALGGKIVGDVSTADEGYIRGCTTNAWNADVVVARGCVINKDTLTAVVVRM